MVTTSRRNSSAKPVFQDTSETHARATRLAAGLEALANLSGFECCTQDQVSALLAIMAEEATHLATETFPVKH